MREVNEESPVAALCPRLHHFAAVAELEHVTQAAARLEIPQPTLSRAIISLETTLGVALFARRGRSLRLTPRGRTFFEHVRRALNELDTGCRALAEDTDPQQGRVAFGFLPTLGSDIVPLLLTALRAAHPRLRCRLAEAGSDVLLRQLRAGEVDLCLTSPPRETPADLATRTLAKQLLVLTTPVRHPLAAHHTITLAQAADQPFITFGPGYGLRRTILDLCRAAGFEHQVIFEGADAETIRGMVAAGLGVALLPPAPRPRPDIAELPISSPPCARTISLIWLRERPFSPAAGVFRDFLIDYAKQHLHSHLAPLGGRRDPYSVFQRKTTIPTEDL